MGRLKFLAKNTGILAVSNFVSKILVFLLVPLYTRVLSTSDVGIYDLIVSTVTLLGPIVTCNIADGVMRFSMDPECSRTEVARVGFKYSLTGVLVGWIILLIVRVAGWWPDINGLEFYISLYFLLFVFNQFLLQTAKGNEKIMDIGVSGIIGTIFTIFFNILFLVFLQQGLPGFFIANILAQAVSVVYLAIRLNFFSYAKGIFKTDPVLRKEMLIYSIPLIATTLGWWVNSTSDRYIVAWLVGVDGNGLLSISYKIPSIINIIQGIFIQAWQISAIKEFDSSDKPSFYGRAFSALNAVMVLACAGLILLTRPLAYVLYGGDFYVAWRFVPFLLISCVLNTASGFLGPILSAKKDTKMLATSAIYGSIVNIVFNILLVFLIGIQGACISTVIASFVIYAFRKKAVKDDIDVPDYSLTYFSWIILCAQAVIEIYTDVWYLEFVLIAVILFMYRARFFDLYRVVKSAFFKQKTIVM